MLDTVIFPELALPMRLLLTAMRLPGVGYWFTSPRGLALTMRLGVVNQRVFTVDELAGYLAPYAAAQDRRVLRKTLTALRIEELADIAHNLHRLRAVPTLIVWADKDHVLPSSEMERLKRDLPQAQTETLPHCGHFLQEDQPEQVSELLTEFLRTGQIEAPLRAERSVSK